MRVRWTLIGLLATGCVSELIGLGPKDESPTDDSDTDLTKPGDSDEDTGDDDTVPDETAVPIDTAPPPEVAGCRAALPPAKRARAVVVAFPYTPEGEKASTWDVLTLSPAGQLSRPGRTFTMGRATDGRVQITRDGTLGIAVQEGGSLGVFLLDAKGDATVVEAAWKGDPEDPFYATSVTLDPSGERAWVVDGNWVENGGGIYEIALDCSTGAPSFVRRVMTSKLGRALHLLPNGSAAYAAVEADGKGPGHAFLIAGWPDAPVVSRGETLFDYDGPLMYGTAVTRDGRFLLVGDGSLFADEPNRIAIVDVSGTAPNKVGELDVTDPFDIVVSPFGNAGLVASGFADTFVGLSYAPRAAPPFSRLPALTYAGDFPALPGSMVMVERGPERGLVLAQENTGIRRLRFETTGMVTDLGPFDFGSGLEAIPGAVGVQP